MQATETGTKLINKDDGSINFRPSPNFKHMKKYLKSKFEEDMSSSSSLDSKESEKEQKVISAVQPPLPPNSPPPDIPLGFTVKKEVEDDEYEQNNPKSEDTGGEKKKAIMCKDFVRKTCTRGAACIYAHELDVSQLKGVYRFCRDFENSRCDRRVCFFVHATTFEKEHFFRTGDLPPHALAHLKPNPAAAPHLAAAAPAAATHLATSAELPRDLSAIISNPPPQPLPTGSLPVQPLISCVAAAAAAEPFPAPPAAVPPPPAPALAPAALAPAALALAGPSKREWRDIDDFSSSPRDLDSKEPLAKKCKHCELTEFRLQGNKAQLEAKLLQVQSLDDRLELENKKIKLLSTIMQIFVMPKNTMDLVNKFSRFRAGGTINKDMIRMLLTNMLINGHGGAADLLPPAARDRPA